MLLISKLQKTFFPDAARGGGVFQTGGRTSEVALPPYPLRYPRPSRPTDIACVASSVPASGGRVETRH